ncbi:hypothetical protein PtB15_2B312 [Puccinia triticina]|nr:hypothetical protein PtB15_2B312 [Puccinia triticina]
MPQPGHQPPSAPISPHQPPNIHQQPPSLSSCARSYFPEHSKTFTTNMFPASSIWKLYVVSVVIAFVGLTAVATGEYIFCDSFQTIANSAVLPAGKVSCKRGNGERHFCSRNSCYFNLATVDEWTYEGCVGSPNPGRIITKGQPKNVHVAKYWTHWNKPGEDSGYKVVIGWDNPNDGSTRAYQCPWYKASDHNSVIVGCSDCLKHDFTEQPPPA